MQTTFPPFSNVSHYASSTHSQGHSLRRIWRRKEFALSAIRHQHLHHQSESKNLTSGISTYDLCCFLLLERWNIDRAAATSALVTKLCDLSLLTFRLGLLRRLVSIILRRNTNLAEGMQSSSIFGIQGVSSVTREPLWVPFIRWFYMSTAESYTKHIFVPCSFDTNRYGTRCDDYVQLLQARLRRHLSLRQVKSVLPLLAAASSVGGRHARHR